MRAPDGSGLLGAVVSWTPLQPELLEPFEDWAFFEREALVAGTRWAQSDAAGEARLSDSPLIAPEEGAVVWTTHPDHRAQMLLLEAGEALGRRVVSLQPAEGLDVIVRRTDGSAVEGATVTQAFTRPGGLEAQDGDRRTRAERCFVRVVSVPASGRVRLAALPEEQGLLAEQGTLSSLPWRQSGRQRAELVLGPTLSVGGLVRFPPGVSRQGAVVRCMVPDEDTHLVLANVPVREDGSWGPLQVPLPEVDEYVFSLEGPSVLPEVRRIQDPQADHSYRIDFEARTGFDLLVHVVDEEGKALAGSSVDVSVLLTAGWSSQQQRVDAEGRARFQLEPSGSVWVRARRSGHKTASLDALELWTAPVEPLRIVLPRAGRLVGHCLHEGRPVAEFTVYLWQVDPSASTSHVFQGREDGSFELDEAPLGEVQVLAWAQGMGASGPVSVIVAPGEVSTIELELPTGLAGRGRVVDASTQEPIAGAEVVPALAHRGIWLGQKGESVATGSDGLFEVSGLDLAGNCVRVDAEGYAPAYLTGSSVQGEEIDLGVARLVRRQDLTVQLRSHAPVDFTTCRAEVTGLERRPLQAFDASGFLRFEALPPGGYDMVLHVGGATSIDTGVTVPPGSPTELVLELDCERTLQVEIVPEDPSAGPVQGVIGIHVGPDLATCGRWYHLPESGRIDLPLCEEEGSVLLVRDLEGTLIGMAKVRAEDARAGSLRLELNCAPGSVRVLDAHGRPVPDAIVYLTLADSPSGWSAWRYSGTDGVARFEGLPTEPLLAFVRHPSKGIATEVPVDGDSLSGAGFELVLDPRAPLRMRVLDGEQPVSGAEVQLSEAFRGIFSFFLSVSGTDGELERQLVTPGRYIYSISGPGLWPTRREVEVGPEGRSLDVQVRRLGSLELHAERLGQPLAGLRIDLESLELGESASEWLAEHRISASAAEMTSDEKGRLRIDGLPHGTYAYRALWKGAVATEGSVEVPASAVGTVRVLVP